jgi:hypothetical protein
MKPSRYPLTVMHDVCQHWVVTLTCVMGCGAEHAMRLRGIDMTTSVSGFSRTSICDMIDPLLLLNVCTAYDRSCG